jgi:hypothetical protein
MAVTAATCDNSLLQAVDATSASSILGELMAVARPPFLRASSCLIRAFETVDVPTQPAPSSFLRSVTRCSWYVLILVSCLASEPSNNSILRQSRRRIRDQAESQENVLQFAGLDLRQYGKLRHVAGRISDVMRLDTKSSFNWHAVVDQKTSPVLTGRSS